MKFAFAGTPRFAAGILEKLLQHGFHPTLVLSQQDKKSGRGQKEMPTPVKVVAQQAGIPVFQPHNLRDQKVIETLKKETIDLLIVVAYGFILPKEILDWPQFGAINVHASLLPRHRGAAPIQRAIEMGDSVTGVTLIQMDEGLDTGWVIAESPLLIGDKETADELHDALLQLGGELLLSTLARFPHWHAKPQGKGATYAAKLTKEEAWINWQQSAEIIARKIRAFNSVPGARTRFKNDILKAHLAAPLTYESSVPAGEVIKSEGENLVIATGKGVLAIEILQKPGGKILKSKDFLAGYKIEAGDHFA